MSLYDYIYGIYFYGLILRDILHKAKTIYTTDWTDMHSIPKENYQYAQSKMKK
jgi:hypothetical protein